MRNLKRALSLAVASVMLLGMMVVGTSAASYPDVVAHDNQEAIEVLKLVSVMSGDENGNFNPEKSVTRNEMAVIMVNLMKLKLNGSHPFTDVPAWADKYVAACYTNGVVSGISATEYGGDNELTAAQAALMVMKTLGYFEFQGEFGNDWQLATVKKATELDLFKDVDASVNEPLTRAEAAQIVFNALDSYIVIVSEKGGMKVEGEGLSVTQAAEYTYSYGQNPKTLQEKLFGDRLNKQADGTDDLGRVTTVWTYKPEKGDLKTAEFAATADYTVVLSKNYASGKLADLVDDILDKTYSKLNADKAIATGKTTWNGATVADLAALNEKVASVDETGVVVELFVNEDDAKLVDSIVAYSYELKQISKIDTKVKEADADDGVKAYVTIKGDKTYNDDKIPGFDVADYEKDDYIVICYGKDGALVETYAPEIVDGVSFSSIASNDLTAKVGSTKYTSNGAAKFGSAKVGADNSYDLYLDANGYVLFVDEVEATKTLDDVYYVLNAFKNSGSENEYGEVAGDKAYVQVVDLAGAISNVEVEYKADNAVATALVGKLVTFKDVKDEDYKAATEYDFEADKTFDKASDFTGEVKTSTKQISGAYLKADTEFVLITTKDDKGAALKLGKITAEVKTAATGDLKDAIVITAKEGTAKIVKYVIVKDAGSIAATYEDKLYVNSTSYDVTEDGHVFTVYNNKGEKIEILCADTVTELDKGFNTYEINDDGEYTLSKVSGKAIVTGSWDGDKHTGVWAEKAFYSYYNGMLTLGETGKMKDIAAADAVVVDLVDDEIEIASLAELELAVNDSDNATLKDVKVSVDIDKDGAVIVFIVAATEVE